MQWLNRIEEIIAVFALVTMSLIAFSNVVSRNLLNLSMAYTEEVTINLFVLLTFVGASIGVRKNAHLGFSLLFDLSPPKLQRILVVIIGLLTIAVFGSITYFGFEMVQSQISMGSLTPALGWPKWIFSLGLPIGSLLCTIRSIEALFKELKELGREVGVSK
ncbi:TRAP transporter small permease [Oceanobacillus sp. AG]|uniref:TRAP transporter small permease n=1 Tax=Oceanobacillus sp. AG TaxID=2681969 RepID=UPI001E501C34|nr:TRAP transporter small permease [Oceanobacillus sp. AG]